MEVACGGVNIKSGFVEVGLKLFRWGRHVVGHVDIKRLSFSLK
jgi:hypothetical protein